MSTGLLVRDFVKEYREVRYSNSGSILLSEIEHNAYRNALTLEITHTDGQRYENLKTLPDNSHYGYVTLFRGSAVTSAIPIKYTKFRVFDIINNGIWQYHQHSESLKTAVSTITENSVSVGNAIIERADEGWGSNDICKVLRFIDDEQGLLDSLLFFVLDCDQDPPQPGSRDLNQYRALPIATPFPDIAKFKSDLPCSFLLRLESWYLVNPSVYITDNPTDTGDETEGEDQYPEPENGDGDGDGDEFPQNSPVDPDADPRDYSPGGTFQNVSLTFRVTPILNGGTCKAYPDSVSNFSAGPFASITLPLTLVPGPPGYNGCGYSGLPVGFSVKDAAGFGFAVSGASGQVLMPGAKISSVVISS